MVDVKNYIYVASCVFTREEPKLSAKIQDYLKQRFHMQIIRCCVPNYKIDEFTVAMPKWLQPQWKDIAHYKDFTAYNTMVYLFSHFSGNDAGSKEAFVVGTHLE
ncbi:MULTISPECIES: hypothetical protein [unclassified Clostridium]|uniref:hypothetical protein n=1 Tax=unclassified Clostridium TaxID=2614128 RepID=UPI0002986EB6|nr:MULTISPECIES: hypothetical protein [unclassified Clostridium]EKQ54384.1 MAG: hypothetical protein A370_03207 [Clostridium sp. Maddingley MBC34-26]